MEGKVVDQPQDSQTQQSSSTAEIWLDLKLLL